MTWICRLFGHRAEVLVLDGGDLRVRCAVCGWSSPGVGRWHTAPKVTQPADPAKVLAFKAKAS